MWLFELLGFTIVVGIVAGLAWRFGEDWLEKRNNRKQAEIDAAENVVVSTTKLN